MEFSFLFFFLPPPPPPLPHSSSVLLRRRTKTWKTRNYASCTSFYHSKNSFIIYFYNCLPSFSHQWSCTPYPRVDKFTRKTTSTSYFWVLFIPHETHIPPGTPLPHLKTDYARKLHPTHMQGHGQVPYGTHGTTSVIQL